MNTKKWMRFATLLCLLFACVHSLQAQGRRSYFTVGPSLGVANYFGDLDDGLMFFRFTKPAFGMNVSYHFDPHMHLRLSANHGWVGGMGLAFWLSDYLNVYPRSQQLSLKIK